MVTPISMNWKFGPDVRQDLQRYIVRRGVVGLRRIRAFMYARFGLSYCEVATLLRKMCRLQELRWLYYGRYYVPREARTQEDET